MLSSSGVKDQLFIRGPSLEYVVFIYLFDVIFWNQALIIRSKMKEVGHGLHHIFVDVSNFLNRI